jgi:hypothetical protein
MSVTQEFQERIGHIDGLVQKLESSADPALRRTAKELMARLMELHGAGLDRMLEIVVEVKPELVGTLADDPLVGSLLILYGLHPDDFETRARRGVDKVRPLLRSHGVRVNPVTVTETSVHIKMTGGSSREMEAAIREALLEAVPDATEVVIEGVKPTSQASQFVPLSSLGRVKEPGLGTSPIPS